MTWRKQGPTLHELEDPEIIGWVWEQPDSNVRLVEAQETMALKHMAMSGAGRWSPIRRPSEPRPTARIVNSDTPWTPDLTGAPDAYGGKLTYAGRKAVMEAIGDMANEAGCRFRIAYQGGRANVNVYVDDFSTIEPKYSVWFDRPAPQT